MKGLLNWLRKLLWGQPPYRAPQEYLVTLQYLNDLAEGVPTVCEIDLPLSWPLYPVLPVMRIGGNPFEDEDVGLVFADGGRAVSTVFLVNLFDLDGRELAELRADPTVVKVQYASVRDLAREWLPG